MAGVPGLDDAFHAGPVKTVTPATSARPPRIARRLALSIFSLIITCDLSRAGFASTSVADPVDGVVAVTG
jgi:hypothetical protein